MRGMADSEQRVCEEDFGSEEGEEADVESYLEDNSSELMDRLRELEAENSALMLANESQREAYERCLDEVANHVVQALLNQKDLREECIKLKMLVYDLERQNRALCELFQQKLPNHPTAHYQVQTGPIPEFCPQLHSESKQEPAPTEAQAKGNGYRSQHASPARGPPTSMEALSPFFKKKAHILEVLRKMEETDPLKFHPSASSLPFCDYSQVLMSTEAVLASTDPLSLQHKPVHPHCHCPRLDTASAQLHANGEPGNQCCSHCKRSADTAPKSCSHVCNASKSAAPSPAGATAAAAATEGSAKARTDRGENSKQPHSTKSEQQQPMAGATVQPETPGATEDKPPAPQDPDRGAGCSEDLSGFSPSPHLPNESGPSFDPETSEDVNIPERDNSDQEPSLVRAGASVSPSPSCLSDVKSAAISSPSKLLKFLKIPSITEKSQANPNSSAVRLSPQLTRNSRIPCRTNNYEVYHSPVPTRRATTTERCRQPPPPPSRSESYPATHSAPTSPPQSDDTQPEKDYAGSKSSQSKAVAPSSSASTSNAATSSSAVMSSKVAQPIPHYENMTDIKAMQESEDFEKRIQAKMNGSERKLVKSLPETVLNERKQSSSSTTESTSDDEEDSDSPVWVNNHSLPTCQPALKAQGANFACPGDRQDTKEGVVGMIPVVVAQPPPPARRTESSSIPKRPSVVAVRSQGDSSQHAFKERLAALGKLRSSDDLQVGLRHVELANSGDSNEDKNNRTVDKQHTDMQKEDLRYLKYAESTDGKLKVGERKFSTQMFEPGTKAQQLAVAKQDGAKSDVSKSKIGLPSPITDAPQVLRNNIKCPGSLNLAYNVKPQSTNSPNKIPPKSPSKPCQTSAQKVSKPPETPRYSSKSEERAKMGGKAKKTPMFGDSLPPPPPKPPVSPEGQTEKPVPPAASSPQSAIEQKVMKGIEENMLKEQDKVGQVTEVKQKSSNGIASWFGLKKSKLPALSRKTDATKGKDEKREWKINIPSVGRDSVKVASRCKEGVEGLNISTLMEKAEGLRRALEEERQFVERQGRGHSCEVVMDQSQGQLAVMYRGGRSDNFMQQLLNRVDGKEVICLPQRRLSFDCKTSKPIFHSEILSHTMSRDDMEKATESIANVTSDENLADSVQHFAAGSGASTYTLDSGIGTFPLPECSSGPVGRGLSKSRAAENHHGFSGSPARTGRRSRTLEREMPTGEDCYSPHRQLIPTLQYGNMMEARTTGLIREDKEGASVFSPRTKTWTFPNLKAPAGPADVYLAVEEEEEPLPYSSPYRGSVKASGPSSSRVVDQGSLPVPAQSVVSRRGKSRVPSVPEMNRGDPALDPLSPSRPQALETPESLSDSLYDSLSSCGSQG